MGMISTDSPTAAKMCRDDCENHVHGEESRLKPHAPSKIYVSMDEMKPTIHEIVQQITNEFSTILEKTNFKKSSRRKAVLDLPLGFAKIFLSYRPDHPKPTPLNGLGNYNEADDDENRLHAGCRNGDLSAVEGLLKSETNLCFRKDRFGNTPLHVAAKKGRVDMVDRFLKHCPESVREVTATEETCLHVAVKHNKTKVVQHLVKWIRERPDFTYLLNSRDYEGNTALHISTSRRQLQTLRVLLSTRLVDVNALNRGSITALDILYVLPYSGKIDKEIDMILREAGALMAQDLTNQTIKRNNDDYTAGTCWSNESSNISSFKSMFSYRSSTLLLFATFLATITYQAAFHLLGSTFQPVYEYKYIATNAQMNKQDSILSSSFILWNTMVFLASVGMILYLLHELPLKPWPQISISALFGSYMCSIMAILPNEALPLLFISVPFLLLAAVGKHVWFSV